MKCSHKGTDVNEPFYQSEAVGYIRVSTDFQDIGKQRDTIKNWFRREKIKCYRFVEADAMSSRLSKDKRRLEFLGSMRRGDIVVSTELSRMSRSVMELLEIVDDLVKRGIRVVFIHNGIDLRDLSNPMTTFALHMMASFAEMERNVISQRTKEGLRILKERGVRLGKPVGTIQHSVFDSYKDKIKEWCRNGFSFSSQARVLGYSKSGLIRYVKTRKIYRNERLR